MKYKLTHIQMHWNINKYIEIDIESIKNALGFKDIYKKNEMHRNALKCIRIHWNTWNALKMH